MAAYSEYFVILACTVLIGLLVRFAKFLFDNTPRTVSIMLHIRDDMSVCPYLVHITFACFWHKPACVHIQGGPKKRGHSDI